MAKKLCVAVGAHPGYRDRANFGRVELSIPPAGIEEMVREQITSLVGAAASLNMSVVHVKPHGALYHAANKSHEVARAIGRAAVAISPSMIMVGQAGSSALEMWDLMGLRCAAEAFADRAYEPDGVLRKRSLAGALFEDPLRAGQQAVNIAVRHRVIATDGRELAIEARTICIHSDTPGSVEIAREVNQQLRAAGVSIRPLS